MILGRTDGRSQRAGCGGASHERRAPSATRRVARSTVSARGNISWLHRMYFIGLDIDRPASQTNPTQGDMVTLHRGQLLELLFFMRVKNY